MLQDKTDEFPPGSVKDAKRYNGSLKDWIQDEEKWLHENQKNFRLYGFDHETMLISGIFPMVGVVQGNYIHGPDFFSSGLFVNYDENSQDSKSRQGRSHHSGWRLLKDAGEPHGIVLLSVSNPNTGGVEILVEGKPPKEWVEDVIKTYYTARRTAMVAQAHFRATGARG